MASMKRYEIHSETRRAQPTAVMDGTMPVAEIGPWLGSVVATVAETLGKRGTFPAGPPFARYNRVGEEEFEVEAGFPVPAPIAGTDDVRASSLPQGTVAVTMHTGAYDDVEVAYEAV